MTTAVADWWARGRPFTIDDLPDSDPPGVRVELIDGSLYVTPLGDIEHQALVMDLAVRLVGLVPSGLQVLPGANVIQGESTLVMPDVVVIDPAHAVRNGVGVSPAGLRLAVEITSPSTRRHDLTLKRELYRDWGTPLIIVDRSTLPFTVHSYGDLPDYARALLEHLSVR